MTRVFAPDDASPALQTVVRAVRAAMADESAVLPVGSANQLDWELVHAIARRHQVIPLVYEGLSGTETAASALAPLRADVEQNTKRNLQSASELVRLVGAFRDDGIRAIPFKGPVLATVAYGDLNRRMFLDLDLLVHPDDVVEAGRVLRSHGYDADEEFELLGRFGRDSPLLADVAECTFYHPDRGSVVELRWQHGHWANPLVASFDGWWRRRDATTLAGREVPVLSPEDRILLLSTHANKHAWRRLAWVVDVTASLCAHDGLDWAAVERRAKSWGVTPALHVAVAVSHSLFDDADGTIPADLLARVHENRLATAFGDRALRRLASDPLGAPTRLEEVVYDFAGTGSIRAVPRSMGRAVAASTRQLLRVSARLRVP